MMRTSHREIRKKIEELKSTITDEAFFSSKAYQAYLTDISEAATRRYRRPLKVTVVADHKDERLAFTDFNGIFINACNEITWSMPGRRLRSMSIEGLNAHENGHNLFTDNRVWQTHHKKLQQGKFYPSYPAKLTSMEKTHADEILAAVMDPNDDVPRMVIESTSHALSNVLEDGYVDARYSYEFPGSPARGIMLNNLRIAELSPDIEKMLHEKYYDHNIVVNLLVQYVNAGTINNLSGYTGELLDLFLECIPIVDDVLHDEDARARCSAVNRILILLWPVMQRCFDALRDRQKQQGGGTGNDGTSQTNAGGQGNANAAGSGSEELKNELEQQLPKVPQNFIVKTNAVPTSGSFISDAGQTQQVRSQIARVLAEETDRIASQKSEMGEATGQGGIQFNNEYEGIDYAFSGADIERVLHEIAEGQVHQAYEEELSEELQQEANTISYGNVHRNVQMTVNRMSQVSEEMMERYMSVAPELLRLSKRLQRSISAVLRDKRQGGKQTGLICGKRLNQHALYRNDGRVFYNTRLPTEPINLAVSLLIDESGSMAGNDRITRARATAIVVQDFCEKLGIPMMITGHTAWNQHVELYSYAAFDSIDKNDRYRLMDMEPRDCNRDGAALRFAAEKLARYPAEVKLLIIICDGQPNDDGYHGSAAEADLRGIQLEYRRKGVQIFAAAIGDDKDRIERIYGSGFLDITDLEQLPIMLTNLIARNLPQ